MIEEVNDLELAFGTIKGYPKNEKDIPKEFWGHNRDNKWVKLFEHLFYNGGKNVKFKFKEGVDQDKFFRWFKAHAGSFSPSHELKTAGVSHFLSKHLYDYKIEESKSER